MNKKVKKILSLVLSVIMILSVLTGCENNKTDNTDNTEPTKQAVPTIEDFISTNEDLFTNLESCEGNIKLELELSIEGEDDVEMVFEGEMDANIKLHLKSMTAYTDSVIEAVVFGMKVEQKQELYHVIVDGQRYAYSKQTEDDEEEGEWLYVEVDDFEDFEETEMPTPKDVFDFIRDNKANLVMEASPVVIDGKEFYKVSGQLKNFEKYLEDYLEEDALEEIPDFDPADIFIDVVLYFNKDTKTLYSMEMDFANCITKYFEKAEDVDGEVEAFKVVITYSAYNTLEQITVPDDVKDSAIYEDDWYDDDWDDDDWEEEQMYATFCPNCDAMVSGSMSMVEDGNVTCGLCDTTFSLDDDDEDDDDEDEDWDEDGDNEYDSTTDTDFLNKLSTFYINNKEYRLGVKLEEFLKNFTLDEDDEGTYVNSDDIEFVFIQDKNGNRILVGVYNPGKQAVPAEECEVYSIEFDSYDIEDTDNISFELGFDFNTSLKEFKNLFGTCSYEYKGDSINSYSWGNDDYDFGVVYDAETNELIAIEITIW